MKKDLDGVLSGWDKMMLAKYYPGKINAPFIAAMGAPPVPTGQFKIGYERSTCWDNTAG
jgi:hypothetical protein